MDSENGEIQNQNTDQPPPPAVVEQPDSVKKRGLVPAWKKGQSGNPKGRPKKGKAFSDIARQLLSAKKIDIRFTVPINGEFKTKRLYVDSDKSVYHGLVGVLISEGLKGNVQAIKELIDRAEGKAREFVDHTTNGKDISRPPIFLVDSDETAAELAEYIEQDDATA